MIIWREMCQYFAMDEAELKKHFDEGKILMTIKIMSTYVDVGADRKMPSRYGNNFFEPLYIKSL